MMGLEVQHELEETSVKARFRNALRGLRPEFGPTLALAGPVVLSELGWMFMGVEDTFMVGRLGPEAIGAVSLGNIIYFTAAVFGLGILLGLDAIVSQAFGAGDLPACRRALRQGLYLAAMMTAPLMAIVMLSEWGIERFGIDPSVSRLVRPYMDVIVWDLPPLLAFIAVRRYLQAMNVVRPILGVLIAANLWNLLGNWLLIEGRWGLPALGVAGSAWSTVSGRVFMVVALAGVAAWKARGGRMGPSPGWGLDRAILKKLFALGLPAALQITLELAVFAIAAALVGRFGKIPLAAHQIALNACGMTFMVPLGVSSAGAVRVGQALGRRDTEGAARAGWTALLLGAAFMLGAGAMFLLIPRAIGRAFSEDPQVIATVVALLAVGAVFQLFDGVQVVASGILRGAGETRWPMVATVVAHWGIGLPVGYWLGIRLERGVLGVWIGLSAGLIAAGVFLLSIWIRRSGRLQPLPEGATVLVH